MNLNDDMSNVESVISEEESDNMATLKESTLLIEIASPTENSASQGSDVYLTPKTSSSSDASYNETMDEKIIIVPETKLSSFLKEEKSSAVVELQTSAKVTQVLNAIKNGKWIVAHENNEIIVTDEQLQDFKDISRDVICLVRGMAGVLRTMNNHSDDPSELLALLVTVLPDSKSELELLSKQSDNLISLALELPFLTEIHGNIVTLQTAISAKINNIKVDPRIILLQLEVEMENEEKNYTDREARCNHALDGLLAKVVSYKSYLTTKMDSLAGANAGLTRKHTILTDLHNELIDKHISAENKVVNFHFNLQRVLPELFKLRDNFLVTFLKGTSTILAGVAGFIAGLPLAGIGAFYLSYKASKCAYAKFFTSKGEEFVNNVKKLPTEDNIVEPPAKRARI